MIDNLRYLFSANGARLDVYSVATGELVYRLGHDNNNNNNIDAEISADASNKSNKSKKNNNQESIIKSICINPINKYQLLSFHVNGRVGLWDYEDGLLLKTFETKLSVRKVIRTESSLFALAKISESSKKKQQSLENQDQQQLSLYKLKIDENMKNQKIM